MCRIAKTPTTAPVAASAYMAFNSHRLRVSSAMAATANGAANVAAPPPPLPLLPSTLISPFEREMPVRSAAAPVGRWLSRSVHSALFEGVSLPSSSRRSASAVLAALSAIEAITVHMEKRISLLAVIGSLGPMIGLLGTLKGMIGAFSSIALSGTQLKASQVAGNISEALVLTFEGVFISVPAIFLFALFKDRVSTLTVDVQNIADELIRKMHAAAQARTAPPQA